MTASGRIRRWISATRRRPRQPLGWLRPPPDLGRIRTLPVQRARSRRAWTWPPTPTYIFNACGVGYRMARAGRKTAGRDAG